MNICETLAGIFVRSSVHWRVGVGCSAWRSSGGGEGGLHSQAWTRRATGSGRASFREPWAARGGVLALRVVSELRPITVSIVTVQLWKMGSSIFVLPRQTFAKEQIRDEF